MAFAPGVGKLRYFKLVGQRLGGGVCDDRRIIRLVGTARGHVAVLCVNHRVAVAAGNSVSVAGAVNEAPALIHKLRELKHGIESAVKRVVTAPRVAGVDELLLAVAHAVIVRGNHRLELAQRHAALRIH